MRRNRESGQTLVLFALGLTVLMVAAGLAIDMGFLRYEKRRMQAAADAAAIAGASHLQYGGQDYATSGEDAAAANGFSASNNATVTVNNPPNAPDTFAGKAAYVQAIVSKSEPTFFMRIVGLNSAAVSASAVAHIGSSSGCFYGLSAMQPAVGEPGDYTVALDMEVPGCGVFDGGNLTLLSSHHIAARSVGFVGTYNGSGIVTPTPIQTVTPNNPLAYLPTQPNPGTCPGMPLQISSYTVAPQVVSPGSSCGVSVYGAGNVEFQPGTYTGQIQISGYATVTFDPGLYVLGNGLSITATNSDKNIINLSEGLNVQGTGVTFYNSGGAINICTAPTLPTAGCPTPPGLGDANANSVNLSAPTAPPASGLPDYEGVLIMQDPLNTTPGTINGNYISATGPSGATSSYTVIQGDLYFPTAPLTIINLTTWPTYTSPQTGYAQAVSQSLFVGGNIDFGSNYSSLQDGSPIKAALLAE